MAVICKSLVFSSLASRRYASLRGARSLVLFAQASIILTRLLATLATLAALVARQEENTEFGVLLLLFEFVVVVCGLRGSSDEERHRGAAEPTMERRRRIGDGI